MIFCHSQWNHIFLYIFASIYWAGLRKRADRDSLWGGAMKLLHSRLLPPSPINTLELGQG
jgi:hypothetical protein